MPSKLIKEPVNGGINQVKHPIMLRAGELQRADNCILRPGSAALYKAPGRAAYGTVRSTSITTTTHSTASLTSTNAFGVDFTSVQRTIDSPIISKAAGFGVLGSDFYIGQEVVSANGIPIGAVIISQPSSTTLELSKNCTQTISTGTVTIVTSDIHPGTYIVGNGIPLYTYILSITDASTLTMSAPATTGSITTGRTFSENILGLRALSFDHGFKDLLIAKCQDKLYVSDLAAVTGTFAELARGLTINTDSLFDAVHIGVNQYTLLTGYDIPRVLYYTDNGTSKTVSTRALGMLAVKDETFVGPAIVAGTWSSLEDLGNGDYYFLVTEVAKFSDGTEAESTYIGDPKLATISNYSTESIQITYLPTAAQPVNDGKYNHNTATHWRIYMSPKQGAGSSPPDLANFFHVGDDIPIATNVVVLADTNPFVLGFASVLATDGSNLALFPGGSTNALSQVLAGTHSATVTISGNTLTATSGDFSTVTPGMYIQDANNYIPYGTYVKSVTSSTVVVMSETAQSTQTGQTVYFGNKSTFDNLQAICPVNANTTRRGGIFQNFGIQNIGNFSSGTITGIKVEVRGAFNNAANDTGFVVEVSRDSTTFSSTNRVIILKHRDGTHLQLSTPSQGGQFDLWGINGWLPSDFVDGAAKFGVRLRKIYGGDGESWTHLIDGVRVTIYAGGNTINLEGDQFRTVTISDQIGVSFGSGANGPPPVASTGDMFEGQLILNDRNNESTICGSLPGEFEAFPDVYRIEVESKDSDKIRVIRRLGSSLIVGCQNSIKRFNYFPKETDAEFSRGRCYEDLTIDHGMVGPRAAKLIDLPGRGTVLAYLAHNGLHFTDGTVTHFLNEDLDWSTLIDPNYIHQSVLEVYPHLSLLALYYAPTGTTTGRRTRVMYFSYHPQHVKNDIHLPAVGPTAVEVGSAARLLLNGRSYLFTGHSIDGKVYVEDSGTTDASGFTVIEPYIRTRQVFTDDIGREARGGRIFLFTDADGTNATDSGFTATIWGQNTGAALAQVESIVDRNTLVGGLIMLQPDNAIESFYLQLDKAESGGQTADFVLHFFAYEVSDGHNHIN